MQKHSGCGSRLCDEVLNALEGAKMLLLPIEVCGMGASK